MLRKAVGVGMSDFPEKNVMKVYGSILLALRKGGLQIMKYAGKRYVTLEWPL